MQPNHYDLLGQVQDESRPAGRMTRASHHQNTLPSRSPSGVAPTRSEDSWIEVSSQPSSSSLSSAATNDDIITTGLRVQQNGPRPYHPRSRRRRLQEMAAITSAQVDYSSRETSSSQEEYEESESESDRVLSSSNEDIPRDSAGGLLPEPPSSTSDAGNVSSDEDDNSTALGMRISSSPFVPQPNVFSHPPASQNTSWERPSATHRSQPSEISNCSRRTAIRRNSQASTRAGRRNSQQHSPYNMFSPSHQADHDAALRASLSTLLSCAAAARGLPKPDTQPSSAGPSTRAPPSTFRLVPESVAMDDAAGEEGEASAAETQANNDPPRSRKQPSPVLPSAPKVKRRSSSSRDRAGHAAAKKSRRTSTAESSTSPTIMTWMISAGVVVLFSAISFSAGYVLGREVGRLEATGVGGVGGAPSGSPAAGCGQEAMKGGLRRFRWGTGSSGSGIIA